MRTCGSCETVGWMPFDRACVYGIGKSESTCTKMEGAVSGMRPEVKICGLKKPADAQYVNDAGEPITQDLFL